MTYLGGKTRTAKEILRLILADRKEGQYFAEPFCGGCNVTANVPGNGIANDSNGYLIAMSIGLPSGENYPGQISRELYNDVKSCFRAGSDKYDPGFMGRVGFMASCRGTFFSGYSGPIVTAKGEPRDRIAEAVRGVMRQIPNLQGVEFRSGDYKGLQIPEESLIYCDPRIRVPRDITRDVNFLSRKTPGYVSEEQDFKSICAFYKTKSMK